MGGKGRSIMSQELSDTITYKGVRLSEVPGMAAQISALQAEVERLTADLNDSNDKRQALEIGIRNLSDSRNNLEQEAATLKRENAALLELVKSAPVNHFRWCQDDAQGCDCPSRGWLLKREALDAAKESAG